MTSVAYDEELINAGTHAIGAACAIAAAVILIVVAARHGTVWEICGCSVYAATLIAAYLASTLSHAFRNPQRRLIFRVADQAIIFLFIAGTFTPLATAYLRHGAWWVLTGSIWVLALIGFFRKAIFAHRVTLGAVTVGLYVLVGWLPILATGQAIHAMPAGLLWWILAGGLCYSAGIIFFHFDDRVRYFHAAWHLMVIAGTTCHYVGILTYCAAAYPMPSPG